jgi:hypothetical protein
MASNLGLDRVVSESAVDSIYSNTLGISMFSSVISDISSRYAMNVKFEVKFVRQHGKYGCSRHCKNGNF